MKEIDIKGLKVEGYLWSQKISSIEVIFQVPKGSLRRHCEIEIEANSIKAGLKDQPEILKGKFYASINKSSSSWKLEVVGNKLEDEIQIVRINLIKDVEDSQWPMFITGGLTPLSNADAKSTFLIGNFTRTVSPIKALNYFNIAAEEDYLPAQLELGKLYLTGDNAMVKTKNIQKAIHWFTKAANSGCPTAAFYCGSYFSTEELTKPDYFKATRFYLDAAASCKQDLPSENANLKMSQRWSEVNHDLTIWKLSIEDKVNLYTDSCFMAAKLLLIGGHGINSDLQRTAALCYDAAKYFHPQSIYQLAVLYNEGLGVRIDVDEAYRLFHLAHQLDSSLELPASVPSNLNITLPLCLDPKYQANTSISRGIENTNSSEKQSTEDFDSTSNDLDPSKPNRRNEMDSLTIATTIAVVIAIVAGYYFWQRRQPN